MKGFIVDEVDDEEELSDGGRSEEYEDYEVNNQLDDDDLSLIAENTGQQVNKLYLLQFCQIICQNSIFIHVKIKNTLNCFWKLHLNTLSICVFPLFVFVVFINN